METLFVGTNVIFLPEVDSTNSYAMGLLKNVNLPEGTVIHTANQTAGRGQRGHVWNTLPYSNITASIVLNPTFLELKKRFFLYQVSALACYDVMAEILGTGQYDIKIKWPNDILVNNKKIAGILIENLLLNDAISKSIIGIGLNVKQREFATGIKGTSLELLTGKEFQTNDILKKLCRYIEKYYLMLKQGKTNEIHEHYLQHFFGLDKIISFEINGIPGEYLVKGINDEGYLVLEDRQGKKQVFDVQQVKWIL